MVRLEDQNMTFFHIPKNAGSSITRWLCENVNGDEYDDDVKHATPNQLLPLFGEFGWSFCCVRNPWDRVVSWHTFFTKQGKMQRCFTDFVELAYTGQTSAKYIQPMSNQLAFTEASDYVIRYENIVEDFKIIQQKTNCDVPLGWDNRSRIQNKYVEHYRDQSTIDHIARYHADEIEALGYKFGE